MRSSLVRTRSSLVRMRSSLARMRSSIAISEDEIQPSVKSVWLPMPKFDPSIFRHSVWGAADESVLNTVHRRKKNKKIPLLYRIYSPVKVLRLSIQEGAEYCDGGVINDAMHGRKRGEGGLSCCPVSQIQLYCRYRGTLLLHTDKKKDLKVLASKMDQA